MFMDTVLGPIKGVTVGFIPSGLRQVTPFSLHSTETIISLILQGEVVNSLLRPFFTFYKCTVIYESKQEKSIGTDEEGHTQLKLVFSSSFSSTLPLLDLKSLIPAIEVVKVDR